VSDYLGAKILITLAHSDAKRGTERTAQVVSFNSIYIVFTDLRAMAEGFKSVFKQVARTSGKAAIWTGAAVAGLWVLAKAGRWRRRRNESDHR
jgi:hypothetical protein